MGVDRIVLELLKEAVYLRVPKVYLTSEGGVSIHEGDDSSLFAWYDENNHESAVRQSKGMDRFMKGGGFSHSSRPRVKIRNTTSDYEAFEQLRERFGEDTEVEGASIVLDALDPEKWVLQCMYHVNGNTGKFERYHLGKIGIVVNLTLDSFSRYLGILREVRKNIVTYWGELVSDRQISAFAQSSPETWGEWNEFFVCDGRDVFLDARGNRIPRNLLAQGLTDEELSRRGYHRHVPVEDAYKVAERLHESSFLSRDVERLHKGQETLLIVSSEITRNAF